MSHSDREAGKATAVLDESMLDSTALPPTTDSDTVVAPDVQRVEGDEKMADPEPLPPANGSTSSNGNSTVNGNGVNGADVKMIEEKPTRAKKKSRLQWDEENLTSNALEMERTPRMKIDEPKTPFVLGHGSEAGSSTSGSAPHSPASPAVAFIPAERLQGFQSLEDDMGTANGKAKSASAGSSNTRTVHIVEDAARSSGSSPRSSSDFEAKRKRHYQNEARLSNFASSDSSRSPRESPSVEVQNTNIESTANGPAVNGVAEAANKVEKGENNA